MQSITLISATNRLDSKTEIIANYYLNLLKSKGINTSILSLKNLPNEFIVSDLYGSRSDKFQAILDTYIINTDKFVFITPEYNGSFAGILKVFLDAIPPKFWLNNKACLVGVAAGRAGNLIGLEHLTTVLNHLKIHVYHNKLPISMIDKLLDPSGNMTDDNTQKVIESQIEGFLKF